MPQCQPPRPQASRVPRAPTATASAPRAVARAAPAKREAPASTTKVPDSKRTASASTRVPDTKKAAPASTRVADAKKNVPPSTRVPDTKHAAQAKWAATPRPPHCAAPATRSATASKSRQPRDAAVTPASTASASLPSGSALGVAAAAAASVSPRRVLELAPGLRGPASSSRCRRQSLNGTVYDLNNVTWSELDGTVIPAEEPDTTTVADPDVLDVQGRSDGDVEAFVRTGRWPRARVVHDDSFDVGALRCRIDRLDEEADRYRACIELAYQGTIAGRRVHRAPTWVKDMIAREREDSS